MSKWIDQLDFEEKNVSRAGGIMVIFNQKEKEEAVLDLVTHKSTVENVATTHQVSRGTLYKWSKSLLTEDGKCFIIDYYIFEQYRNNGIGKVAFGLLEEDFLNRGATYIDLNISYINNERFWISNGFLKTDITVEENNFIYRKTL